MELGNPWRNLFGAVVALTIRDLVTGSRADKADARKAMDNIYFDALCEQGCGLDPAYVRQTTEAFMATRKPRKNARQA